MKNLRSYRTGWRPAVLAAAGCLFLFPSTALAGGAYWAGFKKYWLDFIGNPSGVVLTVLLVGVISLLIITRVKGNKS